jgi:hypothetical protein
MTPQKQPAELAIALRQHAMNIRGSAQLLERRERADDAPRTPGLLALLETIVSETRRLERMAAELDPRLMAR